MGAELGGGKSST
jgi:hypothetical protein